MLPKVILILTLLSAVKGYLVKGGDRKEVHIFEDKKCDGAAVTIPEWFDWRESGKVTPIRNQENCGSGWAFAIVAAVESHFLIHYNISDITLSEQFLIDCIGNYGCNYGRVSMALGYIVGQYLGIYRAEHYKPYQGIQTECTYKTSDPPIPLPAPVTGFRLVLCGEESMAQALYEHGPLIAAINSKSMTKYTNGIDEPTEESCDPSYTALNHIVLVVGYNIYVDTDSKRTVPYWIIKNSWGTEWGDEGYYYLVRGKSACGIGWNVAYPYVR